MLNWIKYGLAAIFIFIIACTGDKFDEPEFPCGDDQIETTYRTNIKEIVDRSCATPQCHNGDLPEILDYRTYDGMLPELSSGLIEREVFDFGSMPIAGSEGEAAFREEDKMLLRCWLNNNFPR